MVANAWLWLSSWRCCFCSLRLEHRSCPASVPCRAPSSCSIFSLASWGETMVLPWVLHIQAGPSWALGLSACSTPYSPGTHCKLCPHHFHPLISSAKTMRFPPEPHEHPCFLTFFPLWGTQAVLIICWYTRENLVFAYWWAKPGSTCHRPEASKGCRTS